MLAFILLQWAREGMEGGERKDGNTRIASRSNSTAFTGTGINGNGVTEVSRLMKPPALISTMSSSSATLPRPEEGLLSP